MTFEEAMNLSMSETLGWAKKRRQIPHEKKCRCHGRGYIMPEGNIDIFPCSCNIGKAFENWTKEQHILNKAW